MPLTLIFDDRSHAGSLLAGALSSFSRAPNAVVLALPRGGVPVAFPIAKHLHLPLDVIVVRKLDVPGHEELAMGAIASGGVRIMNQPVVVRLHISPKDIEKSTTQETAELHRREIAYRGKPGVPEIGEKTVILVDDGIATGSTMQAAVYAVRQQGAARIIVATPAASQEACAALSPLVDEIIVLTSPENFQAVGQCYRNFPQVTDQEVRQLLGR